MFDERRLLMMRILRLWCCTSPGVAAGSGSSGSIMSWDTCNTGEDLKHTRFLLFAGFDFIA